MKKEWLTINVTAGGSPERAEHDIVELFLQNFWPIKAVFVFLARDPRPFLSPNNDTYGHSMKMDWLCNQ